MKILLPSIRVPTPFGGYITLPDLELPPVELPQKPDRRTLALIGQGLGEDVANFLGLIPWVGTVCGERLEALHRSEIFRRLSDTEFRTFQKYNTMMPSTPAMIRTLCFKKA